MVEDPITLLAVMVMLFAHVWMAIIARNDARAKGFEALLFLCFPPYALVYYTKMPRRRRKGVDYLNWLFLVSTAVVIYRVY